MKNIIVSIVLGAALLGAAQACHKDGKFMHNGPHAGQHHGKHHGKHMHKKGHHRGFGAIRGSQRSNVNTAAPRKHHMHKPALGANNK